jgi:uncharacterized protein (DUF433 family)
MEPITTQPQFLKDELARANGDQSPVPPEQRTRIVITPGTCGGKPRLDGHRITVKHLVRDRLCGGMSDEEIVSAYPGLTLADISAAFTYYDDHHDEIDADIRADDEHWAEIERNPGPLIDQIRRRQADVPNDSHSS